MLSLVRIQLLRKIGHASADQTATAVAAAAATVAARRSVRSGGRGVRRAAVTSW